MKKNLLFFLSLMFAFGGYAQSTDHKINQAINTSDWFEVYTLYTTQGSAIQSEVLHPLSKFFIHHFFNQPDSALFYGNKLLTEHQAQIGGSASSFIFLMSQNFAKINQYNNAAGILKQYNEVLEEHGVALNPLFVSYQHQYQAIADKGGFQVIRPSQTVEVPMSYLDSLGQTSLIHTDALLNGLAHQAMWDTGAGENVMSVELAEQLNLPIYDFAGVEIASTVQVNQAAFTILDSLVVGDLVYKNVPFQVVNFGTDNEQANAAIQSMGLDFILGVPCMLALEEIQFDFAKKVLRIPAEPSPKPSFAPNICSSVERTFVLSLWDKRTHKNIHALLDTGSMTTTLTSRYYAANRKLLGDLTPNDSIKTAGLGGVKIAKIIATSWEYSLDKSSFIKEPIRIEVATDATIVPPYDCVFGMPSLNKQRIVYLNFKDMWFSFDTPAQE